MHILIVRNNSNSQAIDASLLLVTYLATQGIDYTVVDSSKLGSEWRSNRNAKRRRTSTSKQIYMLKNITPYTIKHYRNV